MYRGVIKSSRLPKGVLATSPLGKFLNNEPITPEELKALTPSQQAFAQGTVIAPASSTDDITINGLKF